LEKRTPTKHLETPGLAIGLQKISRDLIRIAGSPRIATDGNALMLELVLGICLAQVFGPVLVGLATYPSVL
jgi:hypothetical protein